jgi:hypothetical protein
MCGRLPRQRAGPSPSSLGAVPAKTKLTENSGRLILDFILGHRSLVQLEKDILSHKIHQESS